MEVLSCKTRRACLDCYAPPPDQRARPERVRSVAGIRGRGGEFGGFRSVHALPLRLRGESIVRDLFQRSPGPLPASDLALGQALADVATIGILQERSIRRGEVVAEQLQTAFNSRVVVEQAKGVLAQHHGVAMDVAFDLLRSYARNRNLRLAEVARQLAGGILDPAAVASSSTGSARV